MEERERRGPYPKQGEGKPRLTALDVKEISHLLVTSNQIASGSSSDVYHIDWRRKSVAAKVLKVPDNEEGKQQLIKEFKKRCELLAELRSPYLVQALAASLDPQHPILLSDFMEEGSLEELIARNPSGVAEPVAIILARDILEGLKYLHSNNVAHLHLNPSTILLWRDRSKEGGSLRAKIAGVGSAKAKVPIDSRPETQYICTHSCDKRCLLTFIIIQDLGSEFLVGDECSYPADVYSFGAIFYKMFLPEHTQVELFPFPRTLASAPVCEVIDRCCSIAPSLRPEAWRALLVLDMQTKLDWVTFKQQKKKRVVRRYEMHKKSQADGGFMALQSKAFEGSTSELFVLARMYSTGDGVRQDKQKAIELYQIAADLGHSTAQFNLAVKYATGDGVEKDEKRAAELYQLAADKGDPVAQYNLALKYAEGKGVEKNDRKAVCLYQLAALQGDPEAQYNLARRYRAGRGIIEDHAKAESLYEMAADGGNRKAQRHVYRRIKPATSAPMKQI